MESRLAGPEGFEGSSCRFTRTESNIFGLIMEGMTRKEIAGHLKISIHTVKTHIEHVYKKLGVHNAAGAVAKMVGEYIVAEKADKE